MKNNCTGYKAKKHFYFESPGVSLHLYPDMFLQRIFIRIVFKR